MDEDENLLVKCECCGPSGTYHTYCLDPPTSSLPKGKWRCKLCMEKEFNHRNCSNVFGFNPSKKRYTLQRFGMQANEFKTKYFGKNHANVDYTECEKEFWRLINDDKTDLCVEYGADLSAKNVGSGFPTKYKNKSKPEEREFIESDWNLNRIALLEDSALRFIPKNISGMIVPWCYVGMCFSCFCWHIEDHWCYSINYMHMGEPKTWYGIPSSSAEEFELLMKREAGDLFESSPDLLHHMTTMYDPSKLTAQGIPVYRADQFPGEFMITFPRAYHAGLNQGFNFAEAVNMCPCDWFDYGLKSIDSYAQVYRPTVFSHSELLCRMASLPDELSADFLMVVIRQLEELLEEERILRKKAIDYGIRKTERFSFEDCEEERRECELCKTTLFTSTICCNCSEEERVVCLKHYDHLDCCTGSQQTLLYRYTLDEYSDFIQELKKRLAVFQNWFSKFEVLQDFKIKVKPVKQDPDGPVEDKSDKKLLTLEELEDLHSFGIEKKYPKRYLIQLKELIGNIQSSCRLVQDMITQCNIDFNQDFISQLFKEEVNSSQPDQDQKKNKAKMRKSLKSSGSVSTKMNANFRKLSLDELGEFVQVFRQLPCQVEEKDKLDQFVESIKKWQTTTRKLLANTENNFDVKDKNVPDFIQSLMKDENQPIENDEDIFDFPPLTDDWKEIFSTIPTTSQLEGLIQFANNVCVDLPELKSLNRIFNSISWLENSSNCLKLDFFTTQQINSQQACTENDDAASIASTADTGITESVGKSDIEYQSNFPGDDQEGDDQTKDINQPNENDLLAALQKSISSSRKISFQKLIDLQEDSLTLASTHSVISLTYLTNENKTKLESETESKNIISQMNHLDLAVLFLKKRIDYTLNSTKVFDDKLNEIIKSHENKMELRSIYILLENISKFPVRLTSSSNLLTILKKSYKIHKKLEALTWFLSMHLGIEDNLFTISDSSKRELAISLGLDPSSRSFTSPSNNLEPDNVLSKVNKSITLWMSYIDGIKETASNLPVTFNALGKIEKIVHILDNCKIDLANIFIRPFSSASLIDVLLPRSQKSIEILLQRDEMKNRNATTCKNANSMTGAGSGPLGSTSYAYSLKENSKILVKALMDFREIEDYYNAYYHKQCEDELGFIKQLRISNNYKSSEADQNKVVYCVCRQAGFQGLMLQCECCKDWFHNRCVAFPTKDLDMAIVRFICPRCQRTSRPDVLKVIPILERMRQQIIQIFLETAEKSEMKQDEEESQDAKEESEDSEEAKNLSEALIQYLSACPEISCAQLLLERVQNFQEKVRKIFTTDLELITFLKHFESWFGAKFPMNNFLPEEEFDQVANTAFERRNIIQKPRISGNFLLSNGSRLTSLNDPTKYGQKPDSMFNISPFINRQTTFPMNHLSTNGLINDLTPSGTLISLTTAAATANANFARKNVRKSPLEARAQVQRNDQNQYHIPDMSSKIGMGYVPRSSETMNQNTVKKLIEPPQKIPVNQSPRNNNETNLQLFKYRLPQQTREILDEILFESCLIEMNIPMTRWLWQMRIACDQDADYPGASNPLKARGFEEKIVSRANRLLIQLWEKQLLPPTCLDGAIGGVKTPVDILQNPPIKTPNQSIEEARPTAKSIPSQGDITFDNIPNDNSNPGKQAKKPFSPVNATNKGRSLISGMKRKYSKLTSNKGNLQSKNESTPCKTDNNMTEDNHKVPSIERSQRNIKKPDSYKKLANYSSDYMSNETATSQSARTQKRTSLKRNSVGRKRSSVGSRGASSTSQGTRKNSRNSSEANTGCQAGKLCQRPKEELVEWICCDRCESWYHMICVGIKNEIPDGDYLCPTCVNETVNRQSQRTDADTGGASVLLQAFDVLMTD